jgi:hypothetical protein
MMDCLVGGFVGMGFAVLDGMGKGKEGSKAEPGGTGRLK